MSKIDEFLELHETGRRLTVWTVQAAVFVASGIAAFLLRFDFALPPIQAHFLAYAIPVWLVTKILIFRLAKLDRGLWKYVSVMDLARLAIGNVVASVLSCLILIFLAPSGFPRSLYVLDLIVCFLGTCGLRMIVRIVQEMASNVQNGKGVGKNTLIYGAGDAGVTLLREIRNNQRLSYRVKGFLDDNPGRVGLRVSGLSILGSGNDVSRLVKEHNIKLILIAIPSASGAEMTRILELCHAAQIECKTIPGLGDFIEGGALAGQIREVAVEDLLGRTPIRLQEDQIRRNIKDKVVLVTGAAGSIGSGSFADKSHDFTLASIFVGYEVAESPLFENRSACVSHLSPFIPRLEVSKIRRDFTKFSPKNTRTSYTMQPHTSTFH